MKNKTSVKKGTLKKNRNNDDDLSKWILKLYIAGQTPKCVLALVNLKKICEEELKGQYKIKVIDLLKNPKLGRDDQIFAIPTLVRKLPVPMRKIIGDLSNKERVLIGLELREKIVENSD